MTEQTEDKEFAEFLKIARKESLTDDDSKALQDALKAHPQWLKDQTKTDQMFPQPVLKPGKDGKFEEMSRTEACGFEKTDCIRNVINAAAALNKEKDADGKPVLSDEAFGNFMGTTDSKTGRNFATVVARNLAANEFKSKKAKSPALKDVLDNNHESLVQTLETIKTASPDLMKVKDGNAIQAAKYVERTSEAAELNVAPQTNQGETYQIGGTTNDLNVKQAKPNQQDLNVEAEDETKMADIQQAEKEDEGKGEKPHFDRVKEQDIIDFMFNDWFLASINWAMEKAYGWADGAVNKLCTAYQPTPKTQATAQQQPATQTPPTPTQPNQPDQPDRPNQPDRPGRNQDGTPRPTPDAATMFQGINQAINDLTINDKQLTDVFKAALEDIKNNADKNLKPEDWQTTYLNPKKHRKLMEYCTKLHNKDPEAFNQLLHDKGAILKGAVPELIGETRLAASLAVIAYASDPNNLGKPMDEEALTAARGRQKMILSDMKKTRDIMLQHNIDEYRTAHHLDENAVISDKAMLEIQKQTVGQYRDYMESIAQSAIKARDDLAKYYDADDKTQARANLDKSRKELMDSLSGLGNIPKENETQPKPRTRDEQPQDLHQEAVETNKAERYEQHVTETQSRAQSSREADRSEHTTRQSQFDRKRNGPTQETTTKQNNYNNRNNKNDGR